MDNLKPGIIIAAPSCLVLPLTAQEAPAPGGASEQVAKVKQSLQASMAVLRQYEWIETTVVSVTIDVNAAAGSLSGMAIDIENSGYKKLGS